MVKILLFDVGTGREDAPARREEQQLLVQNHCVVVCLLPPCSIPWVGERLYTWHPVAVLYVYSVKLWCRVLYVAVWLV